MSKQASKDNAKGHVGEPWKVLRSKTVFEAKPWIKVQRDELELPDGKQTDYYVYTSEKLNVGVVALTPENEVILLRQYKHPTRSVNMEPVGGICEEGEKPAEAAKREMLEESGYVSDDWEKLGVVYIDSGITITKLHLYLARKAKQVDQQNLDLKEFAEVVRVPVDKIPAMLGKEIKDSPRITALTLALQKLGIFP